MVRNASDEENFVHMVKKLLTVKGEFVCVMEMQCIKNRENLKGTYILF